MYPARNLTNLQSDGICPACRLCGRPHHEPGMLCHLCSGIVAAYRDQYEREKLFWERYMLACGFILLGGILLAFALIF